MKKTYIIPNTEIDVMVEDEALLAGSPDGFTNALGDPESAIDGGDALSREFDDLWD